MSIFDDITNNQFFEVEIMRDKRISIGEFFINKWFEIKINPEDYNKLRKIQLKEEIVAFWKRMKPSKNCKGIFRLYEKEALEKAGLDTSFMKIDEKAEGKK